MSMFRFIETGPLDHWTGHGYAVVIGDQRGTAGPRDSSSCSAPPRSARRT
ncbi:hypothetical protein ACFVFI_36850 [Streptomyces sp. NPDC057705]